MRGKPKKKRRSIEDIDFITKIKSGHDLRSSVHVKLFADTKKALRVKGVELEMSLQQILECFIDRVVNEDPYIIKMLNKHKIELEKEEMELFSQHDADSIFAAIAGEND